MDELRIAACEDEPSEYEMLHAALAASGHAFDCEHFATGEALVEGFYADKYDLVLLDIYLDGGTTGEAAVNGMDVAARLREIDPYVPIAFVTTSPDHALDGYRLHVNRYLCKPFEQDEIDETLELARRARRERPGVSLRIGGREVQVPLARIRYAEQQRHSFVLHLADDRELKSPGKLDDLEEQLPQPPFFRCHKSYLVNLAHVKWLDRELNVFEMAGGGNAYIRRASVRDATRALERFMSAETRKLDARESR